MHKRWLDQQAAFLQHEELSSNAGIEQRSWRSFEKFCQAHGHETSWRQIANFFKLFFFLKPEPRICDRPKKGNYEELPMHRFWYAFFERVFPVQYPQRPSAQVKHHPPEKQYPEISAWRWKPKHDLSQEIEIIRLGSSKGPFPGCSYAAPGVLRQHSYDLGWRSNDEWPRSLSFKRMLFYQHRFPSKQISFPRIDDWNSKIEHQRESWPRWGRRQILEEPWVVIRDFWVLDQT